MGRYLREESVAQSLAASSVKDRQTQNIIFRIILLIGGCTAVEEQNCVRGKNKKTHIFAIMPVDDA